MKQPLMSVTSLIYRIKENLPEEEANKFAESAGLALDSCTDPALAQDKFVYWLLGDNQREIQINPKIFNGRQYPLLDRPDLLAVTSEVRNLYRRRIAGESVTNQEWNAAQNNARIIEYETICNEISWAADLAACAAAFGRLETTSIGSVTIDTVIFAATRKLNIPDREYWETSIDERRVGIYRKISVELINILMG